MIYKRFFLLMIVASLSACSSVSSLIGIDAKTETPVSASAVENDEQAESTIAMVAPPSEEQLLVQSLLSQSDLYKPSKRTLAPELKAKVADALSKFNKGEFEQSEKLIKNVLANELNLNSTVHVLAGDIALANKKQAEAMSYYRAALELNDYNAMAANRLAMQMREQGEFTQAEKLYTQAINAQPGQAESYRNRAVLYDLYLDEKAKAFQDYKAYAALLNHSLAVHESAVNETRLSDAQLKSLKTNIKLVKRWLSDVGRQVAALAKAKPNNNASGN